MNRRGAVSGLSGSGTMSTEGMRTVSESGLLGALVAAAARRVAVRTAERPLAALEAEASRCRPDGDAFLRAVRTGPSPRIVAECKRRSPARGVLRHHYHPAAIARAYASAGAAAVSVLTEPAFFDGHVDHLWEARRAVALPLLRKDIIVSPYQVVEARAAGADAILLIVAALDSAVLRALLAEAERHGLACLVEVHDEKELEQALDAGARLVGVNSRDLRTLQVDRSVLHRLIEAIPDEVGAVAESGLSRPGDVAELERLGYDAFLIGERLMTAPDPGAALGELRAAASEERRRVVSGEEP